MLRVLGATESIIDNPSGAWVVVNNWMYNTASTIYDHLEMQHSNSPMARRYWNHPHRWYVALDKQSIKSVEPVYIPIVESRLRIPDFTDENDPRYVSKDRGALKGTGAGRKMVCEFCETKGFVACSCTFHSIFPGPLIEIMETDRKGLGVRSLQVSISLILNNILFENLLMLKAHRPLNLVRYWGNTPGLSGPTLPEAMLTRSTAI